VSTSPKNDSGGAGWVSTISGVAVGVLESVFGPRPAIPFTTADLFDPNLKRPFNRIAEMDEEHKNVRVWGGIISEIHWRSAMT
jgi:hypothetical protein